MTYRGRVRNGVVILDPPASLAEGCEVEVRPVTQSEVIPSLYEGYKDFIGTAEGLPPDSSRNQDHYIHGSPKRASS